MSNIKISCISCNSINQINFECISCGDLKCINCIESPKCLKCNKDSDFKQSLLSRRIIEKHIHQCEGCYQTMTYEEYDLHKLSCPNYMFTCKVNNCLFKGSKFEFLYHLRLNHERDMIDLFNEKSHGNMKGKVRKNQNFDDNSNFNFNSMNHSHQAQDQFFLLNQENDNSNNYNPYSSISLDVQNFGPGSSFVSYKNEMNIDNSLQGMNINDSNTYPQSDYPCIEELDSRFTQLK